MLRLAFLFVFGVFLCGQTHLEAQQVEPIGHGHVHEAFMTNEAPITLLQAISEAPPSPLDENIPKQTDPDAVWVEGYWDWSKERNSFVWCSGGWRVPPPDHQWIPGYWKKMREGWIRLQGFWSEKAASKLTYISKPPPDTLNENPTNRPSKDDFWMAGYWKYEKRKYVWYSGKWEKADPDWIYVPPKYVWRPEGYVFVPAYWDWPLEVRGTAYACVTVPKSVNQIDYGPDLVVSPIDLINGCLLYYPDYCYFYYYYTHFHIDWWINCPFCPPWWGWDWWWLPWFDQWAIWWWWVAPGFPAPIWLPNNVIIIIFGPPLALIQAMQDVAPPLIVTPDGVVPPATLLDALKKPKPIFPEDPTPIQEEALNRTEQGEDERPGGDKVPIQDLEKNPVPLPETTTPPPQSARPGEQPSIPHTIPPPPKPSVPIRPRPPIKQPEQIQPRYPEPQTQPPPTQQWRQPEQQWSPPPSRYPPSQQWTPPRRPPQHWQPPRGQQPPNYYPPRQPSYPPSTHKPSRPPSGGQYKPYVPQQPQFQTPSQQPQRITPSSPQRQSKYY